MFLNLNLSKININAYLRSKNIFYFFKLNKLMEKENSNKIALTDFDIMDTVGTGR